MKKKKEIKEITTTTLDGHTITEGDVHYCVNLKKCEIIESALDEESNLKVKMFVSLKKAVEYMRKKTGKEPHIDLCFDSSIEKYNEKNS